MKTHTHRHWLVNNCIHCKQILCAGLVGAAVMLGAGCHKSAQSSAPTAAEMAALRPLNQALLDWRVQNRRVPTNFAEFAASATIKIPPPPPEKKYVINSHGLITLVNAK